MISYFSLIVSSVGFLMLFLIGASILQRKTSKNRKLSLLEKFKLRMFNYQHAKNSFEYSFNCANELLKFFINHKNYKYELGWFLTTGLKNSGKSSFLVNAKLERPIEAENFLENNLNWYFFNKGVVLDLKGDLFEDEKALNKFLQVLEANRENLATNGVIHFISLKDFIGPDKKSDDEIIKDAMLFHSKMWNIQSVLKVKFPVYIVLTHLDILDGFQDFVNSLDEKDQKSAFGWSVPYSLDLSFNENWIDDMFRQLESDFSFIKSKILLKNNENVNEKVIAFFYQFKALKKSINLYCKNLFHENSYSEGFYFRGIYFSGGAANLSSHFSSFKHKIFTFDNSINLNDKYYFSGDLLEKKIFAEKGLSKQLIEPKKVQAQVKIAKGVFLFMLFFGNLYIFNVYRNLQLIKEDVNPKIVKILNIVKLRKTKLYDFNKVSDIEEFEFFINCISEISSYDFFFYFVFSSWFSNLDSKLERLLEIANNQIILKSLKNVMEKHYKNAAEVKINKAKIIKLRSPIDSFYFSELKYLIDLMCELEELEEKFYELQENGGVFHYAFLIKKMLNIDMPKGFYKNSAFFSKILKKNNLEFNSFNIYKEKIRVNFENLSNNFLKEGFECSYYIENFSLLNKLLNHMQNNSDSFLIDDLKRLQTEVSLLVSFFNSVQFSWIEDDKFSIAQFNELIKKMETSIFFQKYGKKLQNKTNSEFINFKKKLNKINLPILGYVFCINNENRVKISSNVIEFQGMMNFLFSKSFMQQFEVKTLSKISYGQFVLWSETKLNEVLQILKEHDEFLNQKLESYPKNFKITMKKAANKGFEKLVESKIVEAQTIVATEENIASLSEFSDNMKVNFATICEILTYLKKLNLNIYHKFKDIEKLCCYKMVDIIDNSCEHDQLYKINSDMFSIDEANQTININQNISDYLSIQKTKMEYYALEIFAPVFKMIEFLQTQDKNTINLKIQKWINISKDFDLYKINSPLSKLLQLEKTLKLLSNCKIEAFYDLIKNATNQRKKDEFFENALLNLKSNLLVYFNAMIDKMLLDQYNTLFKFYKKYEKCFPFDFSGYVINQSGYDEMMQIINKQSSEFEFLKKIYPNLNCAHFDFVENLVKISKLIKFLNTLDEIMLINIKKSNEINSRYESNLKYLLSVEINVKNQPTVAYPDAGSVKFTNNISFSFKIAAHSDMRFVVNKKAYKIIQNELRFEFDKPQFIAFLFKNALIINDQIYIKFNIPIMNSNGVRKLIVFILPIEISLDGLVFSMPKKNLSNILKGIKR